MCQKMTRNCRKMIKQTGDSSLLSKHSIQLSAIFLLLSGYIYTNGRSEIACDALKSRKIQVLRIAISTVLIDLCQKKKKAKVFKN